MDLSSSFLLFRLCFHMGTYTGIYGGMSIPVWIWITGYGQHMANSMDAPRTPLGWPTGVLAALKAR